MGARIVNQVKFSADRIDILLPLALLLDIRVLSTPGGGLIAPFGSPWTTAGYLT
jgi:hypothetical protein